MVLQNYAKRKLLALINPWLAHPPQQVHLKVGLIRSHLTLKSLKLDPSALNTDSASTGFRVDQLTVEEIIIELSNWDVTAVTVDITGVKCKLSVIERRGTSDTSMEDMRKKKKTISKIDPEGSTIHEVLERISVASTSRNLLKNSFWNLVFRHCHLRVHNIDFQVQFPLLDNSAIIAELKEFNAESQFIENESILRSLGGALFVPVKDSSFTIDANGFQLILKRKDDASCLCTLSNLSMCVKLKDLKLENFSLCIPELYFLLSMVDLPVLVAFGTMLSQDSGHGRNGRELWKLAASRISHVASSPQLALHKVINVVLLWLRYVAAYEYLLSQVGYSLNFSPENSLANISRDKMVSEHVKQHLKQLTDIEKVLPAELVARGRQVSRYRVAVLQCTVDRRISDQFFHVVIHHLAYIWNFIYRIFDIIKRLLFLKKISDEEPDIDADNSSVSQDPHSQRCFIFNLGKVVITVSQVNTVQPSVIERLKSQVGDSISIFTSFALSISDVLLLCDKKMFKQSFLICCGQSKVDYFPHAESSISNEASSKPLSSGKGFERGSHDDGGESIIWFEPIETSLLLETRKTTSQMSSCDPFMEELMRDMLISWKTTCMDMEESENSPRIPCLLGDSRSFLTYPGLGPDSGFSKFCSIVGKLNLTLTFSSIVSISLLLKQMEHALSITKDGKTTIRNLADQPEESRNSLYNSFAGKVKKLLLGVLPERHVQIGLLLAGPHILLSLREEGCNDEDVQMEHAVGQDNFQLAFDFQNMEIAVWPTSIFDFVSLAEFPGLDNLESDSLRMRELQKVDVPEAVCGNYISQGEILHSCYLKVYGICAYLGESTENWTQILALKPICGLFSSSRKYVHSFSTSDFALSAAFGGMAAGLTVSYMEELMVFLQVLGSLCSQISYSLNGIDPINSSQRQEYIRQEVVSAFKNEETNVGGYPMNISTSRIVVDGNFKLKSVDMVLSSFRLGSDTGDCMRTVNSVIGKRLAEHGFADRGLLISVQGMCLKTSFEDGRSEVLIDMSGMKSSIFKYQDKQGENANCSVNQDLYPETHDCVCEISIPYCNSALWLGLMQSSAFVGNKYNMGSESIFEHRSSLLRGSDLATDIESSKAKELVASNIEESALVQLFVINVRLGGMYIGSCSAKKTVLGAHQLNELILSLHVGGEFQSISFAIKGGVMFLDTAVLSIFVKYVASYRDCIIGIWSNASRIKEGHRRVDRTELNVSDQRSQTILSASQVQWELTEACTVEMSEFSFVLMIEEESGDVRELALELEFHSELKSTKTGNTFILDLARMSVLSQFLEMSVSNERETPHFASTTSESVVRDQSLSYRHEDENRSISDGSCTNRPITGKQYIADDNLPEVLHIIHQNYILKQLTGLIHAKPEESTLCSSHAWVGSGFLKGCDITIAVSELQFIFSVFASLSGMNNKVTAGGLGPSHLPISKREICNSEAVIPDGAIVAIQDAHQHMYISIEGGESKYSLSGANHYCLVGERALFRVKHHKPRIWKSPVLWFSLVSLHAKNDSGEPLRLNYRPGSGFVDISGTSDSGFALWRALPFKPESFESDIDWEPYNQSFKNTFYLINKKNGCAVAFINKVPEFVKKPGHPLKLKVFYDHPLMQDGNIREDGYMDPLRKDLQANLSITEGTTTEKSEKVPCIYLTIDEVSLTVVHELPDRRDRVPLLQVSMSDNQCPVQILSSKARIISTSRFELLYYEAQRNMWRELIHPVEICIFYRFGFQIQSDQSDSSTFPSYFHCRTTELNVYMSQLSLDVLLFVVGELNLAGPYSLRSSVLLANCCKVENRSGSNVLCQFQKSQSVRIAREQSGSIFLGHSRLANQPPGSMPVVSIRLSALGSFTTSSIDLPLLESRALAWRTRIISLQDSRSYPGPFIVVDFSNKSEDGLVIAVSPLIKVRNETKFPVEIRFQRPQQMEDEVASVLLQSGDMIDDSMAAFDAINSSGGLKKALLSLSVGNFIFSFRPEVTDSSEYRDNLYSAEWSDDLKGGKAVRLAGIFDKLSYNVRKALSGDVVKCSFTTTSCTLKSKDASVASMHFLIQSIERDIPIIRPDKSNGGFGDGNLPVAVQQQKEIFILPTVRVSNLLHTDIDVLLTETGQHSAAGLGTIGKRATLSSGSTVDLYVNPAMIYFSVTILAFNLICKPVDSGDWAKKLHKKKNDVQYLDIDLDFSNGKLIASLRLSRDHRGILEAVIFTAYALKNDSEFSLIFCEHNQKSTLRDVDKFPSDVPPELGLLLPPKTTRSWFLKSNKMHLKLLGSNASGTFLDLDALSGITEIGLEMDEGCGVEYITNFGMSMGPCWSGILVPSRAVQIVPRYVVYNESKETVFVRQCYLEDDVESAISVGHRQRKTLLLRNGILRRKEYSLFENIIRKHRSGNDDSLKYIQFRLSDPKLSWSGPLCISSRGRFFLKFRKEKKSKELDLDENIMEFAVVHMVEEGSVVVLHFHKPPNVCLPYRVENYLHESSITYYQKDSSEPEILGSGCSVDYVWDDLTLSHKLVVQINDMHLFREISLDKVRAWKPLSKVWQHRSMGSNLLMDRKPGDQRIKNDETYGIEPVKVGYEVYADGPTRVVRICEYSDSHEEIPVSDSCSKIRLRVPSVALHLLECDKRDMDGIGQSVYTPVVVVRIGLINLDSVLTVREIYTQLIVQSLNVEPKWVGAPFAATLRRHHSDNNNTDDSMFKIALVLLSANSSVIQVKYSSIVLQPFDLNLDEETLMRVVPFWRSSLSSNTQSQQYYFDHFEIHPIKIIASFLPGESYSSYSSAQETLRSLLHSIIKVPPVKNMAVELNGVFVTHALITTRELLIKCTQHYSWYAMRAISIAKGSSLLPPDFASMFDDIASSSLDVFFDPAHGLDVPGVTLGTFRFISKCIKGKGISGTRRYFGDLGKTLRAAGSNAMFAAVTEVSDSVLKGAEASGFKGMVSGFHQGILRLAMEPSVLGTALMEGGPDRKIKLDQSPGVDELYIEGYLQAMLDTMYKQEYLRVRVIDDEVFLKNLPPNSTLIEEIMDRIKGFLVSKALLKGDLSTNSRPLRHLRGESEFRIGPTILTLCEHLFVSFSIRMLRKQSGKYITNINWKKEPEDRGPGAVVPSNSSEKPHAVRFKWKWGIGKFIFSGLLAYIDGRLCRCIPNPIARRIVSGFLLSFIDTKDNE